VDAKKKSSEKAQWIYVSLLGGKSAGWNESTTNVRVNGLMNEGAVGLARTEIAETHQAKDEDQYFTFAPRS